MTEFFRKGENPTGHHQTNGPSRASLTKLSIAWNRKELTSRRQLSAHSHPPEKPIAMANPASSQAEHVIHQSVIHFLHDLHSSGNPPATTALNLSSPEPRSRLTLLSLPSEIRNYIYNIILFDLSHINAPKPVQVVTVVLLAENEWNHWARPSLDKNSDAFTSQHTSSAPDQICFTISEAGLEFPAPEPLSAPYDLMSTCKSIRQELRPLYFSSTVFFIATASASFRSNELCGDALGYYGDWLKSIGEDSCSAIRQLMLLHCDYDYDAKMDWYYWKDWVTPMLL